MSLSKPIATMAVSMLVALASRAEAATRAKMPPNLNSRTQLQQPRGVMPSEQQAYVEATDLDLSYQSATDQPDWEEQFDGHEETTPECCDLCGEGDDCCCDVNYRSGWSLSFDASALQSQMTTRDVDAWPHEFGAAGRITLGYEGENGFGIRTQAWGYGMQGEVFHHYYYYHVYNYVGYYPRNNHYFVEEDVGGPYPFYYGYGPISARYSSDLELHAATAYLDFYKSISTRYGEWLIGGGPAFGHLEFISPPAGDGTAYYGGGISLFSQGSFPIVRRHRWELAIAAQARAVLLTGGWTTPQYFYYYLDTTSEHSKGMSILELGIGPEIRYRFGRSANHYWYLRTLAEFQQWRSDEMGPMGGDTLGLQGATVSLGVGW
jgi:hypothetical protein